ncbi:MAG: hypothetical protein ACRDTH_06860 [Pseudonocardiaceae bacterium]
MAILTILQDQIKTIQGRVEAQFGQHPGAGIYLSQPGLDTILGARVLGEFGDDPHRYTGARARKDYADQQRRRGLDHSAALRPLADCLVGILHG